MNFIYFIIVEIFSFCVLLQRQVLNIGETSIKRQYSRTQIPMKKNDRNLFLIKYTIKSLGLRKLTLISKTVVAKIETRLRSEHGKPDCNIIHSLLPKTKIENFIIIYLSCHQCSLLQFNWQTSYQIEVVVNSLDVFVYQSITTQISTKRLFHNKKNTTVFIL